MDICARPRSAADFGGDDREVGGERNGMECLVWRYRASEVLVEIPLARTTWVVGHAGRVLEVFLEGKIITREGGVEVSCG